MTPATTAPSPTSVGHPPGLYVLFFTEMWERFSYYGMRAILLAFLIDNVSGGMGLTVAEGAAIYGIYTSSVYLLSLPGGWIADTMLGQRKAIFLGGIIIMLGHIVLAIPGGTSLFYIGLVIVSLGTGLLKPNISTLVGELYPEGGARKDAAFSIFYMGINLGSLLGITLVGYLGQKVGWHYGFVRAAFIAYCMGTIAMMAAALISGFIIPEFVAGYQARTTQEMKTTGHDHAALMQLADPSPQAATEQIKSMLQIMGLARSGNQVCSRMGVLASAIAYLLWSLAMLRSTGTVKWVGILGTVVGLALSGSLLLGYLPMNVHGMLVFVTFQACWSVAVGYLMFRRAI